MGLLLQGLIKGMNGLCLGVCIKIRRKYSRNKEKRVVLWCACVLLPENLIILGVKFLIGDNK